VILYDDVIGSTLDARGGSRAVWLRQ